MRGRPSWSLASTSPLWLWAAAGPPAPLMEATVSRAPASPGVTSGLFQEPGAPCRWGRRRGLDRGQLSSPRLPPGGPPPSPLNVHFSLLNFLTGMDIFGLPVQRPFCNHEAVNKRIKAYIEEIADYRKTWSLMASLKYGTSPEQLSPHLFKLLLYFLLLLSQQTA